MEFKIGDKVRVINMNNAPKTYGDMTNKMGVIKWNSHSEWGNKKYGIAFEDVKNHSSANGYFYFSNDNLELICNNIPTLLEIREKKLTCVVHTKSKTEAEILIGYIPQKNWKINLLGCWNDYAKETGYYIEDGKLLQYSSISFYKAKYPRFGEIYELEEMLEPVDADGGKIAYAPNGAPLFWMPTPEKPVSIEEQLGLPKGVSIHDLPTSELIKKEFNVAWIDKIALPTATETKEMVERVRQEILRFTNAFPKEEKKLKFTFYVTDWVDINKTNGEKIPMKRTVAYIGSNTDVEADTSCPVAEYDERIGCLIAAAKISAKRSTEAKMMYNIARSTWGTELSWAILFELANTAFNGNFERVYKKFHNDNIRFEKKRLTCSFCGKVFETIEEKTKHENEHIQNKKNKREKYLIRKEAKRRLAEAEREGKIEQTMKELYKK